MTSVRSPGEDALLRASLERLAAAGLPVAVAETGLSAAFSGFLAGLENFSVVVPKEPGLVPQVKAGVELAAQGGTPFILYTESDKEQFFRTGLWKFLRGGAAAGDAGVVLAARSDESFGTFPPMQRYTEGVINRLCGVLLACRGDYSYARSCCIAHWRALSRPCRTTSAGGGATASSQTRTASDSPSDMSSATSAVLPSNASKITPTGCTGSGN